MKHILKWIGIILGSLIGLILIVGIGMFMVGRNRLNNAPEVAVVSVSSADGDPEHGQHIAHAVSACVGCHGENFEGKPFIDEAPIGYVPAPNLTATGLGADYSDEDWARAIRHGVGSDGRTLVAMPSSQYAHMSDSDLADLIAYFKTVPDVENAVTERSFMVGGNVIFGNLAWSSWPVNAVDHENVGNDATVGVSSEYGEYLSHMGACRDCHGADLLGADAPDAPQGPTLEPIGSWSQDDFITAIRTGITPSGSEMSAEMPWREYSGQTDDELVALWMYLGELGE